MFWRKRKEKTGRDGPERRREPRCEDGCTVTLTPKDKTRRANSVLYYARTKDASPSGLKIDTDVPFPVGTVLTIKLQSPRTRQLIQALGEVKWVTPYENGRAFEVGLEFVETSVRSIMDLLEHIYRA
jgi:Tfp pilus assembly protein PilZ